MENVLTITAHVALTITAGAMKVSIVDWHAVAIWQWDVAQDDVCGICRVPFDGTCADCKAPGDDCPLIWGKCTHVFHMHCLYKWLNSEGSKQQCPMDRRPFVQETAPLRKREET